VVWQVTSDAKQLIETVEDVYELRINWYEE